MMHLSHRYPAFGRRILLAIIGCIGSERQALFRDRRVADVAAQPLQSGPFMDLCGHTRMHGKSGHLAHLVSERLVAGRWHLQDEHFVDRPRAHGHANGDRESKKLIHRPRFRTLPVQVAVLGNCAMQCNSGKVDDNQALCSMM